MTDAHSIDLSKIKQVKKDGRKGGNRKPMTTNKFLARARKVHGDRFCYKKTEYTHSTKNIIITCKIHGDFEQVVTTHLRSKHGCQQCSKELGNAIKVKSTSQFIINANKVHSNKYDYSKTKYIRSTELVTITCPTHGDFERTPNNHLNGGYGCNACAGVMEYDTEFFISRAKEVHEAKGVEYDYSKAEYKNAKYAVEIICALHGSFFQVATEHLKGYGCQECGKEVSRGWSRSDFKRISRKNNNGNATLYVIKCLDGENHFYKLGVTTTDLKTRFRNTRSMPYEYSVECVIDGEAGYIYDLEVKLHLLLKNKSYEPNIKFRGYTECFTTIKPIIRLLKELSNTDQLQLIA